MRLFLAAATTMMMLPATAHATDWYRFYANDATRWYLDADSIKNEGQWTRVDQFAIYGVVSPSTGVKAAKATMEIDCRRRVYRLDRFEPMDGGMRSMGSSEQPDGGKEHLNVANSPNDAAMKFVCDNVRSGALRVADPVSDAG
jgi:hypothetical protein